MSFNVTIITGVQKLYCALCIVRQCTKEFASFLGKAFNLLFSLRKRATVHYANNITKYFDRRKTEIYFGNLHKNVIKPVKLCSVNFEPSLASSIYRFIYNHHNGSFFYLNRLIKLLEQL